MDSCILLHQDILLEIRAEQKRILRKLNEKTVDFFPVLPLCIEITNPILNSLKISEIKSRIKSISLLPIEHDDEKIFYPVEITIKDENRVVSEKLIITEKHNKNIDFPVLSNEMKSHDIKIFRISEIQKNGFTTEFRNEIWCKLK